MSRETQDETSRKLQSMNNLQLQRNSTPHRDLNNYATPLRLGSSTVDKGNPGQLFHAIFQSKKDWRIQK